MRPKSLTTPARYWLNARCERWLALDRDSALWFHSAMGWPWLVSALAVASRLGNGIVWYTLAASMPFLAGQSGWECSVQMVVVGAINLLIYVHLKRWARRDRPFVACADITACTRVLDRFSFPSGHTLHAVTFSLIISSHYPPYAPLTWGFAALIALSRLVLGLHYPTDVIAGALIGFTTGWAALTYLY